MHPRRRSPLAITFCVLATIALVAADIGSKTWAEDALSRDRRGPRPEVCATDAAGFHLYQRARRPDIELIPGYLELQYAENCGAAFGLLSNAPGEVRTGLFGVAAIAATIAFFWLFATGRGGVWFALSVPLVISGAVGNFIDRIRYGYVVDFIYFHVQDSFHWPTFNAADIAITLGVAMFFLDAMRTEPARAAEGDPAPAPSEPALAQDPAHVPGADSP